MKYPLNTEKVILALETESHVKMEPELKELLKCLVPLLNDAYESGHRGEMYSSCWVKIWEAYFGSEPDPKTKRLLGLTDSAMNRTYEEGRRNYVAAMSVRLKKSGAAV